MEAATIPGGDRVRFSTRSPLARFPDRALKYGLTVLAGLILALIVYFFVRLVGEAKPAFAKFGVLGFTFDNDWNVNAEQFGALPLLVGTMITSVLALLIGVPVAVATAAVCDRALPAAGARADHRADRAARRGALGRIRAVGHLLPGPEAPAGRAVGGRPPVLHPVHRRRRGHDPQLFRHRPGARDHDPADRLARSAAR